MTENVVSEDEDDEPLCCCEYMDVDGRRTHLLFVGCDCEALDTIVDRLIRGQKVPQDTVELLLRTLDDRTRIPAFRPQGAVHVGIGFFCALLGTALLLLLLSLHFLISAVVVVLLPCCALFVQRAILRHWADSRFFYYWTLWSFIWLGLLFCWENGRLLSIGSWFAMTTLYSAALFAFWKTKRSIQFAPISHESKSDGAEAADLCRYCKAECADRRRHCRVCNRCVDERDHHCVWIDSCVSPSNRLWFRLGLIFSSACAFLGVFLSTDPSQFTESVFNIHGFTLAITYYSLMLSFLLFCALLKELWALKRNIQRKHL